MPTNPAIATATPRRVLRRWLTLALAAAAIQIPPLATSHALSAEHRSDAVLTDTMRGLLQRAERDYRLGRGEDMLNRLAPAAAPTPPMSALTPARPTPVEPPPASLTVSPAPAPSAPVTPPPPVAVSPAETKPPAAAGPAPPLAPIAAIPPATIAPNPGAAESLRTIAPKLPEVKSREAEPPPSAATTPEAAPPRPEPPPERTVTYAPAEAPAPAPAAVERRLAPVHCRDLLARAQLGDVTQAEMTLLRTQCR